MAAFRTLWTALAGLYEETLILLGGNVAAVALNVPLGIVLVLLGLPFATSAEPAATEWLIALAAWALVFLPTPGNLALAGLTQGAASPEVPHFVLFRQNLRTHWRLAVGCSVLSVVVFAALIWNVSFYLALGTGWPLLVTMFWLYATLFWLSLHLYLVPLAVYVAEPRLLELYRRAAFVALGHPGYTFLLLVLLLLVSFVSVVFLPIYVLLGPAFVSLAQAHALREIRRRHGDLLIEPEEEVSRL